MNNKKTKLIVANFKMNLSIGFELKHWMDNFKKGCGDFNLAKSELVLCPPVIYLNKFFQELDCPGVSFGAQNCFWDSKGAYTGEISPEMIAGVGGKYVILGHSERRYYLGETDEIIALKVGAAIKGRLRPIVCIGENMQERNAGRTREVILGQLKNILGGINKTRIDEVVICYEPVWAISTNGSGILPIANDIMEARLLIKKFINDHFGSNYVDRVRILYGGSVNVKNVEEVCVESGVDGALIGNASLAPYDLLKIAKIIDEN